MWTYKCYITNDEPNLWEVWYNSHPKQQGRHDAVFEMIESMEIWGEPHVKRPAEWGGLMEVRFKADNVQWRVFGFYGEARREFIVVGVGNHKGNTYDPKKIIETAQERMKEVKRDGTKASRCGRPGAA